MTKPEPSKPETPQETRRPEYQGAPTQTHIDRLYAQMYEAAQQVKARAQKSSKHFAIVVVDLHTDHPIFKPFLEMGGVQPSKEALFVQKMALDIGKKSGIKTFVVEADAGTLNTFITQPESKGFHLRFLAHKEAKKKDFDLVAGDPLALQKNLPGFGDEAYFLTEDYRAQKQMTTLTELERPFVAAYGVSHLHSLQGYWNNQVVETSGNPSFPPGNITLRGKYEIFYVNGANISEIAKTLFKIEAEQRPRPANKIAAAAVNYITKPENAFQAVVEGNAYSLSFEQIYEMAEKASLTYAKDKLTTPAEKDAIMRLEALLKTANKTLAGEILKEFKDIVDVLAERNNQLTSPRFNKEFSQLAAKVGGNFPKTASEISKK